MRERVDALGVAEPEIQRTGSDQIEVGLPGVAERRARRRAGRHDRPAVLLRLGAERPRRELQDRTPTEINGGQQPRHRPLQRGQARRRSARSPVPKNSAGRAPARASTRSTRSPRSRSTTASRDESRADALDAA